MANGQAQTSAEPVWNPMETAPKDGTPLISYRSIRWKEYRPDGKRQMKAEGRWQECNGYGWENCKEDPGGWLPMPQENREKS